MDLALGTVTVVALVMTVAMAVVTWRLVHEERRRAATRLAALEAELERRGVARPQAELQIPRPEPTSAPAGTALFGAALAPADGWSRRLAGIGIAAVLLAGAVGLAIVVTLEGPSAPDAAPGIAPHVELVALDHERQGSFLAISGSVRLPSGEPPAPLAVMAMLFDREGNMVASGRVPLDIDTSASGGDTPFSISLPGDEASRYRITFLSEDGTVPHVDRRRETPERTDTETTSARHVQEGAK